MESLCPHHEPFVFDGESFTAKEILAALDEYITPRRQKKIRRVVETRTYTVVPVIERVYDRGNISAVMRSAESMGYQALHIIEAAKTFRKASAVTQGADKWLDIRKWKSTRECVDFLRSEGRRIVVTDMNKKSKPLDDVSFAQPTAIFFGSEGDGASEELRELADDSVIIPMDGFTQSFNISVAAALCFYHIRHERIRETGCHADLTDAEREALTANYFMRSVAHSHDILLRSRRESTPESS